MDKVIYYFVIGSFIGWIMEVTFKTISGENINRAGMGKGPFCAAYGVGIAFIAVNMSKYSNNTLWLFISTAVIGTIYEHILGTFMEKVFGIILWDYTKLKFYINRHICLEFVILWGIFGTLFITKVLPILNLIYSYINLKQVINIIYILAIYICIDYGFSAFKLLSTKKDSEENEIKISE
ncbi:MAG: putative ABC transporter permease [Clostridia bacterium]